MNIFKKNLFKICLIIYSFFYPFFILYAQQDPSAKPDGKIVNPIPSIKSIPGLIHSILNGMLTIGIPVIALAIIYSGFLFVSARGNPEKITKAKDAFFYTLIGAAILLGSWAIAQMIDTTIKALG